MRAVCRDHYGTPDDIVVRDMPRPVPGAKDALVQVHATTINRTDCGVLSGQPYIFRFFAGFPRPRSAILGTDFAGTVVEVGAESRWKVGDRVMGFHDNGLPTQAELVCVPPTIAMIEIPAGIDFDVAAASMEGFHYALNFVSKAPIAAGQHILVIGGTGAIGSAMIQILKDKGCTITAVCGAPEFARVEALGADRLVDYLQEDVVTRLAGERFAHVFDAVGKSTFGVCRQLLAKDGVYSSSELGPWGQNLLFAVTTRLRPGQRVIFPVPLDIPRSLALSATMLRAGTFVPLIDKTVSMAEAPDAYRYAVSGKKIGNLILHPRD